MHGETVKNR